MRQYFLSIPREIEEAARIDGAGFFTTFWRVMLPLAGTGPRGGRDPPVPGHLERLLLAVHHPPGPRPVHSGARSASSGCRRPGHELAAVDGGGRHGDHAGPRPVPLLPALLRRRDRGQWRQGLRRRRSRGSDGPRARRRLGDRRPGRPDRLLFQLDATGAGEPGVGRRPCPDPRGRAGLAARAALALLPLLALPTAGVFRLAARIVRASPAPDCTTSPGRIATRPAPARGRRRGRGGGARPRHERRGRAGRRRARGWAIATLAGWGLVVLWCGALVAWPLARRPGRTGDAARRTAFAWPAGCSWPTRSGSPGLASRWPW